MEHRCKAFRAFCLGWQAEPRSAGFDPLLGAADALGDGRLGDQKRSRDLGGAQAAHRPQGQRDLRYGCQGGMAAEQEQLDRVIRHSTQLDVRRR
jgi:hypothetical protein